MFPVNYIGNNAERKQGESVMLYSELNRIAEERGFAAAARAARAAQHDPRVATVFDNGKFLNTRHDPTLNRQGAQCSKHISQKDSAPQKQKRAYGYCVVDKHGGKELRKVVHWYSRELVQYVIVTTQDSEDVASEPLGHVSLKKAREALGKQIVHPVDSNAGVPTNVGNPIQKGSAGVSKMK